MKKFNRTLLSMLIDLGYLYSPIGLLVSLKSLLTRHLEQFDLSNSQSDDLSPVQLPSVGSECTCRSQVLGIVQMFLIHKVQ